MGTAPRQERAQLESAPHRGRRRCARKDLGDGVTLDGPRRLETQEMANRGEGVLRPDIEAWDRGEVQIGVNTWARRDPWDGEAARIVRSVRLAGAAVVRRDEDECRVEHTAFPQRVDEAPDLSIGLSHRGKLRVGPPSIRVAREV